MIVPDKTERGEIVNGELDEIRVKGPVPTVGTVQPIQAESGKDPICHVHIDDVWHHADGGFMVRFHRAEPNPPRLLKRVGGYTSIPDLALPGEPEAVSEEQQDRITQDAHSSRYRQHLKARTILKALPLEQKIVALKAEADSKGINVRNERRVLDRLLAQGKDPSSAVVALRKKLDSHVDKAA